MVLSMFEMSIFSNLVECVKVRLFDMNKLSICLYNVTYIQKLYTSRNGIGLYNI